MSVDTNTTNKNLLAYDKICHSQYGIYITPILAGMASRMVVTTKGRFIKHLAVEFDK